MLEGFSLFPPLPPSFMLLEMFTFCVIDLKAKMANSTEAEIRSLQSHLLTLREDTNSDLRKNVFKKCVPLYLLFFCGVPTDGSSQLCRIHDDIKGS